MDSPFLVVDSPQIGCVSDPGHAVTQVVVRGRWDGALRQETSRVLRACVAESPRMVLVDLAQLADPAGESALTWHIAARYAMDADPQVAVVLCAAPPAVRHRLSSGGGDRVVLLADSVEAARAAAPSLNSSIRQQHVVLSAQPAAAALARTMAGDACLAFGAAHLVHPVRLLVSELVANAVEHTGTDIEVRVSLRGELVHLGIQDGSRELPRVFDAVGRRGVGLRVVTAAATAWGALPCRRGKVVWATLVARVAPA